MQCLRERSGSKLRTHEANSTPSIIIINQHHCSNSQADHNSSPVLDDNDRFTMTSPVTTRHTPKVPSLTLPVDVSATLEARPPINTTPPPSSTIEDPVFHLSPKTSKSDMGRSKSQSRRTLGNWQLGKTIGQGSMGRVRLGHNLITGEQVSIL